MKVWNLLKLWAAGKICRCSLGFLSHFSQLNVHCQMQCATPYNDNLNFEVLFLSISVYVVDKSLRWKIKQNQALPLGLD